MKITACALIVAAFCLLGPPGWAAEGSEFTTVHRFTGYPDDASDDSSALIVGGDGNFYGTSRNGGSEASGAIFRLTPTGQITILHSFDRGGFLDGYQPQTSLLQASDGNFYGVASSGGPANGGTLFRLTPTGAFTVLHVFAGAADGARPAGALIQGRDGSLYGVAGSGGSTAGNFGTGYGVIYRMALDGTFTVLHVFADAADGAFPLAALVRTGDGSFCGVTQGDTFSDEATVFRLAADGTLTTLHRFAPSAYHEGFSPVAGLLLSSDGNLYGTTSDGGAYGGGTIFRLSLTGNFAVVHSFNGQTFQAQQFVQGGAGPNSTLVQTGDGSLFGTTSAYNSLSSAPAVLFRFDPANGYSVLHLFRADPTGLTFGPDGSLYGGQGNKVYRLAAEYINPPTPVVTLTATTPVAHANYSAPPGVITFSIPAPAARKFKVNYLITTTTSNVPTSRTVPGVLKFKVGQKDVPLTIPPPSFLGQGTTITVKAILQAGDGYIVSTPSDAEVEIVDD